MWYKKSYRRNAVDIHIEDWEDGFLSDIDTKEYVRLLKKSKTDMFLFYTNSHTGHCLWPTKTGTEHRNCRGRDVVRELIDNCHGEHINIVLYYSMVFNNIAYDQNPDWRMKDCDGIEPRQKPEGGDVIGGRYGVCCINSGYRDFALAQIAELCENYQDADGFFMDMVFWPEVCYCDNCRRRFKEETGEELPEKINWGDKDWILFQEKRKMWMKEFAKALMELIHSLTNNPDISITHQFGATPRPWTTGFTEDIADFCDYVGGDFYGGIWQESFICKYFNSISKNMPFEYITAACEDHLGEHTAYKSEDTMKKHVFMAMAHGGSFMFVNPVEINGTVNYGIYETMEKVFEKTMPFEGLVTGRLLYDYAVLFDQNSQLDIRDNGMKITEVKQFRQPHLESCFMAANTLTNAHMQTTVIGCKNIKSLSAQIPLIITNHQWASDETVCDMIEFIKKGGSVYISGITDPKLLLALTGCEADGYLTQDMAYMNFHENNGIYENKFGLPLSCSNGMAKINSVGEYCQTIANVCLPFSDKTGKGKFVSIHSNPPYKFTSVPALVKISTPYGGTIIYSACSIEAINKHTHREAFKTMIRSLRKTEPVFTVEAPDFMEATVLEAEDGLIVCIVNKSEGDIIPVYDCRVTIKGFSANKVILFPNGADTEFENYGEGFTFLFNKTEYFSGAKIMGKKLTQ